VEPKLRVWIVFEEGAKFGDGRARLLELIAERGSLRQAAAEFGMSYRNAWGYLRELERAAGFPFVERAPGGHPRSGMRLTPGGRAFLACYGTFRRGLDEVAARRFARSFSGRVFREQTGTRHGRPRGQPAGAAGQAAGRPRVAGATRRRARGP
jgi:molybdate transport system regulatory protein